MGLFDRFKKKSQPTEPVVPTLPATARIATLDNLDGVGTLELEDGSTLRFGVSACRGFEPVVGAHVVVVEAGARPYGGVRATKVELADGAQAEHDALLAARDRELGVEPEHEAPVGAAMMLGTVTVLFDQPIENDRTALRAFFEAVGVLDATVTFENTATPVLRIDGRHVQVFAGHEPLASDQLDVRHLHGDDDLGQGFVSLSTGLATIDAVTPHIMGVGPNPWAEGGEMQRLSSVVQKLAQHGTHVVLHRAGHVVYTADEWLRRLGDLTDPTCRPFTAWIDVGFSADKSRLSTYGLDVARRPDVHVAVADHEDDEEYALAHDALMLGAYLSAHENRIFEAGDVLVVPPGLGVGPHAIDGGRAALVEDSTCARYVADDGEAGVVFSREAEGDAIDDVWSRYVAGAESTLGFLPYRKLLDTQIGSVWRRIASLGRYDVPEPIPPFEVMVFDRGDDFALLTWASAVSAR